MVNQEHLRRRYPERLGPPLKPPNPAPAMTTLVEFISWIHIPVAWSPQYRTKATLESVDAFEFSVVLAVIACSRMPGGR